MIQESLRELIQRNVSVHRLDRLNLLFGDIREAAPYA